MRKAPRSVRRTSLVVVLAVLLAVVAIPAGTEPAAARADVIVERIAGFDRYATAAAAAKAAYPGGSVRAVMASGEEFPDAIAAATYAGNLGVPLLLVGREQMPAATQQALTSLQVRDVALVGGATAVSDTLVQVMAAMGITVNRLGGVDRFETAALLARSVPAGTLGGRRTAIIASGTSLADGLAAGPLAHAHRLPLLLVAPDMTAAARLAITALGIERLLVVGLTVRDADIAAITAGTTVFATRLAGSDRYETAVAIAEFALSEGGFDASQVVLARGDQFADALGAAQMASGRRAPLLLVPSSLAAATQRYLADHASTLARVVILGGLNAISPAVEAAAVAAAGGSGTGTSPPTTTTVPRTGSGAVAAPSTVTSTGAGVIGLTSLPNGGYVVRLAAATPTPRVGEHYVVEPTAVAPGGAIGRVTSVQQQGGATLVTLAPASLSAVYRSINVATQQTIGVLAAGAGLAAAKIPVKCGPEGLRAPITGEVDLSQRQVDFTLTGGEGIVPKMGLVLTWYPRFTVQVPEGTKVICSFDLGGEVTFPLVASPPISVVLGPGFEVEVEAGAKGEFTMVNTVSFNLSVDGNKADYAGSINTRFETSGEAVGKIALFPNYGVRLQLGTNALNIGVEGNVGPRFAIATSNGASGRCTVVDGMIRAQVGFSLETWFLQWTPVSLRPFDFAQRQLANNCQAAEPKPVPRGAIVRKPDSAAFMVDANGVKHWIADGPTWDCEVRKGTVIEDRPTAEVDAIPEGDWWYCFDVNVLKGRVLRHVDGDAHYVHPDGTRTWIPDALTFNCRKAAGTPIVETRWRQYVDSLRDAGWDYCLDINLLRNRVLRHSDGDAHYVHDDGTRTWIPDGPTWDCRMRQGKEVVDTGRREYVNALRETGWDYCYDVNVFKGKILRHADAGDAHYVDGSGKRHWIPTGPIYNCLVRKGIPVVNTKWREYIDRTPQGANQQC